MGSINPSSQLASPSQAVADATRGSPPVSFNRLRLWLVRPVYALIVLAHVTPIGAEEVCSAAFLFRGAGLAVCGGGVLLRLWSMGILHKKGALARTGPYAYTRNPLYLGTLSIGLGLAMAATSPWSLALMLCYWRLFTYLYGHQIRWEEHRLRPRFGAAYDEYLLNVPRFWPRLSPWRKEGVRARFSVGWMFHNRALPLLGGIVALLVVCDLMSGVVWPVLLDRSPNLAQAARAHYSPWSFLRPCAAGTTTDSEASTLLPATLEMDRPRGVSETAPAPRGSRE
jgi:protein-S-isoprenylcysteine O-methyltransferase Ste14